MKSPYMPALANSAKNQYRTKLGLEPLAGNKAIARRNSREPIVASNGNINANSKRDLMSQIAALIDQHQKGNIVRQRPNHEMESSIVDKRNQILMSAAAGDQEAFQAVGEIIGDEIRLSMNREGFTRRLLTYKNLKQGEIGRLRVRQKDVSAWYVTEDSTVVASQVRQPWVFPKDFYIIARIFIEDLEILSSTGDLLQEKLDDGLEQMMVVEDRVFWNLAQHAATTVNDHFMFSTLTPNIWAQLKHSIVDWNLPINAAVISSDLWVDINSNPDFLNFWSEIEKHEIVLEGFLGTIMGVQIITDAFREPHLKVLNRGSIAMFSSPNTLGGLLERGSLTVKAIDEYAVGRPHRGWYCQSIESMACVNSRGVVMGQRA